MKKIFKLFCLGIFKFVEFILSAVLFVILWVFFTCSTIWRRNTCAHNFTEPEVNESYVKEKMCIRCGVKATYNDYKRKWIINLF